MREWGCAPRAPLVLVFTNSDIVMTCDIAVTSELLLSVVARLFSLTDAA